MMTMLLTAAFAGLAWTFATRSSVFQPVKFKHNIAEWEEPISTHFTEAEQREVVVSTFELIVALQLSESVL